jgi:hypothetical protein
MLASDLNNPEFVNPTNPDSQLTVRFYSKSVEISYLTSQEGRPIFRDVDYIEIMTPGDKDNTVDTPAMEHHKKRFPLHWAHYKNNGGSNAQIGTPLEQWPLITQSQAAELKALKFFTVDSIAGASDDMISKIGLAGGMSPLAFREKAQLFLQVAKDFSFSSKQAEANKANEKRIADLEAKLAEVLAERTEPKPKRPYTKKVKHGNDAGQHSNSVPGAGA